MSKPCAHKTAYHHVVGAVWDPKPKMYLPPKPWTYVCSVCTKKFEWSKKASLYGSMECEKCGFCVMDAVVCSDECRDKYDDLLKVRAPKPRSASRKSKAAGDALQPVREGRLQGESLLGGGESAGGKVHLLPVQHTDRAPAYEAAPPTFRSSAELTPTLGNRSISVAEICRRNGWGPGTTLAGIEDDRLDVIYITAVGEAMILAKRVMTDHKPNPDSEALWILDLRDWKKVDKTV